MGVVTRRTGLSPDVLRVWERRYGVVRPTRSEGGQRMYSAADLERLQLLRRLVDAGHRIAKIATLDLDALERLAVEERNERQPLAGDSRDASAMRASALEAAAALDGLAVEAILRRAALEVGTERWLDEVIGPFLEEVGERWHAGGFTPANEHLATAAARDVLGWLLRSFTPAADAAIIVVSTLADEQHELGAMIAAVLAAKAGWQVQYLGPDLPAATIAEAARQLGARVIAVSLVYAERDASMLWELRELREAAPADIAILAGGRAAAAYAARVVEAGAIHVSDGAAFVAQLDRFMPISR